MLIGIKIHEIFIFFSVYVSWQRALEAFKIWGSWNVLGGKKFWLTLGGGWPQPKVSQMANFSILT